MINRGNLKIKGLYLGDVKVKKAYLGTVQVYPNASLALSVTSLAFAASGDSQMLTITVEDGQPWNISVPSPWRVNATSGKGNETLTITIDNNKTTSSRSNVLTVTSEDLSAKCNLTQAIGKQIYGEISIGTFAYADIPAGGGTVRPSLSYSQPWTWNGVAGSGGTITAGAAVAYSGSKVGTSDGAVTAGTKGTVKSGRTSVTTANVKVSLNGESATRSATVYQVANECHNVVSALTGNPARLDMLPETGDYFNFWASATITPTYTSGAKGAVTTGGIPWDSVDTGAEWCRYVAASGIVKYDPNDGPVRSTTITGHVGSWTYSLPITQAAGTGGVCYLRFPAHVSMGYYGNWYITIRSSSGGMIWQGSPVETGQDGGAYTIRLPDAAVAAIVQDTGGEITVSAYYGTGSTKTYFGWIDSTRIDELRRRETAYVEMS